MLRILLRFKYLLVACLLWFAVFSLLYTLNVTSKDVMLTSWGSNDKRFLQQHRLRSVKVSYIMLDFIYSFCSFDLYVAMSEGLYAALP